MRRGFFYVISLMGLIIMSCQNVNQPEYMASNAVQQAEKKQLQHAKPSELLPTDRFTHSVAREAVYYKDGPQQARPADGIFKAGTKLKIIKEAGSYSLVESTDGIKAFIATRDIEMIY